MLKLLKVKQFTNWHASRILGLGRSAQVCEKAFRTEPQSTAYVMICKQKKPRVIGNRELIENVISMTTERSGELWDRL